MSWQCAREQPPKQIFPKKSRAAPRPPSFKDEKFQPAQLTTVEREKLQHGDILLRRGFGMVSNFIADFLKEEYEVTHCGFVVLEGLDEPHILHTISDGDIDGIYLEPLSDFVAASYDSSLALVRAVGDSTQRYAVVKHCLNYMQREIPFDMRFDHKDSSKMYCVEMMWYAFERVYGRDLLPHRAKGVGIEVFHMDNFFDTTNFEIIFNQLPKKDWN